MVMEFSSQLVEPSKKKPPRHLRDLMMGEGLDGRNGLSEANEEDEPVHVMDGGRLRSSSECENEKDGN